MSVPVAPPPPRLDLSLSLAGPSGEPHVVNLATRALVAAVVPAPRWGREAEVIAAVAAAAGAGADLVEVPAEPGLLGPAAAQSPVPVVALATSTATAQAAVTAGAALVLVPADRLDEASGLLSPMPAGEAHGGRPGGAVTAPGPPDPGGPSQSDLAERIVPLVGSARAGRDELALRPSRLVGLDVTGLSGADAVSEEALALAVGVRLVRTADLRRTRRVVEVMARLLEARR